MIGVPAADEPGIAPMEARLVAELPDGPDWRFEPKWDGFRCIAYRDGKSHALRSKSGKPLDRFFPEVAALIAGAARDRFVVDGELVVPRGACLSFGALQARLHPAESRIRRLSAETPAQFVLFDCLGEGRDALTDQPFDARRARLEALHAAIGSPSLLLSPTTADRAAAEGWLGAAGGALDGVVAKLGPLAYRPGERAMAKVKQVRTADCVVGGFRLASGGRGVGSLLLGLYDEGGLLHHVGFTSGLDAAARAELLPRLEALATDTSFTGNTPGGPSRWANARSEEWTPVRPELVVEVGYDQVTDRRFRHGTRLLRWRPDKAPRQCDTDQLARELRPAELAELLAR